MSSAAEANAGIRKYKEMMQLFSAEFQRLIIQPLMFTVVSRALWEIDMERRYCRAEGFGDPYEWMDAEWDFTT